jgi:hypothetical protein
MEQVIDWLNENELRAFPLQENFILNVFDSDDALPKDFLLDLQLKVPFSLKNSGNLSPVYLKSIQYVSSDTLSVLFGTTSAELHRFVVENVDNTSFPVYARVATGHLAVFGAGVKTFLLWCSTRCTPGYEITVNIPVEPSTCVQFNEAWLGVNSISGTPAKQTETAVGSFSPALPLVSLSSPIILTGDVQFVGGYNFRVSVTAGMVDMEVSSSYGLRMNCNTSFISSEYLDCADLVSYINGVPPDSTGTFRLNSGANISLIPGNAIDLAQDPAINEANQHTLFVGLSFQSTDLCAPINLAPITV